MRKAHIIKEYSNGPILARKGFEALTSQLDRKIKDLGGIRYPGYGDYDITFSRVYSFKDEDFETAIKILEEFDWAITVYEYNIEEIRDHMKEIEDRKFRHKIDLAELILSKCYEMAIQHEMHHWQWLGSTVKKCENGTWSGRFFYGFNNGKNEYLEFIGTLKPDTIIWNLKNDCERMI